MDTLDGSQGKGEEELCLKKPQFYNYGNKNCMDEDPQKMCNIYRLSELYTIHLIKHIRYMTSQQNFKTNRNKLYYMKSLHTQELKKKMKKQIKYRDYQQICQKWPQQDFLKQIATRPSGELKLGMAKKMGNSISKLHYIKLYIEDWEPPTKVIVNMRLS